MSDLVLEDGFAHLEGASAYSLDDTASAHSSSAFSQVDHQHHSHSHSHLHHPPHLSNSSDLDDVDHINNLELNFDDLSISALDHHGQLGGDGGGQQGGGAGGVANLYEEDFDGMLDDLNRELPPHACR